MRFQHSPNLDKHRAESIAAAMQSFQRLHGQNVLNEPGAQFMLAMLKAERGTPSDVLVGRLNESLGPVREWSRQLRANPMARVRPDYNKIAKGPAFAKAAMDVGTLTNIPNFTQGQSVGYISFDTQLARATARPNSFTLQAALDKSMAYEVTDFYSVVTGTGGKPPGGAFASYSSVTSNALTANAGEYETGEVQLKLMLDARAITLALGASRLFVDIQETETGNAAISLHETINWSNYWGNATIYPSQYSGIYYNVPASNVYDWYTWSTNTTGPTVKEGWSPQQSLYNFIYEVAGKLVGYRQWGYPSHVFMSNVAIADLQSLVTSRLDNVTNVLTDKQLRTNGIVVQGNLQGMQTTFGGLQYAIDIFINARQQPYQDMVNKQGTNPATSTNPTPPSSVTVAVSASATGSQWDAAFASGGAHYMYAVASTDMSSNESTLVWAAASGVAVGGAYVLTIAPPAANDMNAFRIFRSGLGLTASGTNVVRWIGDVVANGSSNVTFTDLNTMIPGSETIFILDMYEEDQAIDFRYLLPLSRVDLFAQNLYMPWAITAIGALRMKIPQFHGIIKNYVAANPDWNPLATNS